MVQVKRLTFFTVKDLHIERATYRYDNFFASAMSMTATTLTRWDIVSPIDTSNIEWNILQLLSNCQIATWIDNLWQVNDSNFILFHIFD